MKLFEVDWFMPSGYDASYGVNGKYIVIADTAQKAKLKVKKILLKLNSEPRYESTIHQPREIKLNKRLVLGPYY